MKLPQRNEPMKTTIYSKVHERDLITLKANALDRGMTPSQLIRLCLIECGVIDPK
jgi:hypothetical protein